MFTLKLWEHLWWLRELNTHTQLHKTHASRQKTSKLRKRPNQFMHGKHIQHNQIDKHAANTHLFASVLKLQSIELSWLP